MIIKNGLNSFQIKIIALIFMVFDHIHYIFAGVYNIPMWFNILGRLSAPLFIFIVTNGMIYTRNAKKYLLRLWICFVFMNIGNDIINKFFPLKSGGIIINNIFSTLFVICLIIYCMQKIKENKNNKKNIFKYIIIILIPFITSVIIFLLMASTTPITIKIFKIFMTFIPSALFVEGGILFILLGVGLYLCKQNKIKIAIFYTIFSFIVLLSGYVPERPIESMFIWNIQYFMIFSLPIMLLYNNKKGKSMKYFFYLFYPAHIYIFTIISYLISK